MVAFHFQSEQLTEHCSSPVGVFEDDVLLLALAARSRLAESVWPHTSDRENSDDDALESALLAETDAWEL